MGGGKTETLRELQADTLFNTSDDLYVKDMVRLFAITKKVDPVFFTTSMLDFSRKYFSPETFESMGVGVRNTAQVKSLTYTNVYDYLKALYPHNLHAMYYYGYQDNTGKAVSAPAIKINYSLMDKYNSSTDNFSKDFTHTFTFNVVQQLSTCPRMSVPDVYASLHSGSTGPDTFENITTTPAYEVEAGVWYSLKDETINETMQVTLLKLDASWNETTEERLVTVTEDLRTMYAYKMAYSDDLCGQDGDDILPDDPLPVWGGEEWGIFFKEDIIPDISEHIFLLFPLKAYGFPVDRPNYQNAVLQGFGLGNGALDESIGQTEIENALIGYSSYLDDPKYEETFELIYGEADNRNNIVFQSDYYSLSYDTESACNPLLEEDCDGTEPPNYKIYFNNVYNTQINGMNNKFLAMIPVDYFRDLTMHDRYEAMAYTFRLWANTKVVVKTKWYQTGLFKFAMMVVVMIISVITANPYLFVFAIGMQMAASFLSPEIMAVIGIIAAAYGIYSFEGTANAFLNGTSYFAMAANAIEAVFNLVVTIKQDNIKDKIDDTNEATAMNNKFLADNRRRVGFYSPLDSYDDFNSVAFGGVALAAYDSFYDGAYDYGARSFKEGIYLS